MPVPDSLRSGFIVGLGGVYCGPLEEGRKVLSALRGFGPPVVDTYQQMPYSSAQVMADFLTPPGRLNYWKSGFMKSFDNAFIETILAWFAKSPSRQTMVFIEHDGDGAVNRVPPEATAFPHRQWAYNFGITSVWTDPARTNANIGWTRGYWKDVQPWLADEVYVNYLGEEGEERVRSAYGANYARLVALKDRYDPANVFCMNQNIQPSRQAHARRA